MSSRLFDCSLIIGLLLAVTATLSEAAANKPAAQPHVQTPNSPTVYPGERSDVMEDAKRFTDLVMSGLKHDDAINEFLIARTGTQRESIIYAINRLYGNTVLFTVLIRFVYGDYGKAMSMVLSRPLFIYTNELRNAIINANEDTILEVLLSLDSELFANVVKDYQSRFNSEIVDDAKKIARSPVFRDIIRVIFHNRTKACVEATDEAARKEAIRLVTLLEGPGISNQTAVTASLVSLCYPGLRGAYREYIELTGHRIEAALNQKFKGPAAANFGTIVKFQSSRAKYFADKLNHAIHRTHGPMLVDINRIIITRSEIDLNDIQRTYQFNYGTTLARDIATVTDGDHQKLLLAFLGEF